MKRAIVTCCAALLLSAALAAPAAAGFANCDVVDASGVSATSLKTSDFMLPATNLYYATFFNPSKRWTKAVLSIAVKNSELKEKKISGTIVLPVASWTAAGFPFAIGHWYGITNYGNAQVTIKFWRGENYLGSCTGTYLIEAP